MPQSVTLGGVTYDIPDVGEDIWGETVTNYLAALSTQVLTRSGGVFTLTAPVDFGASHGFLSEYVSARPASGDAAAATGLIRLKNSQTIGWRNAAQNGDLGLSVNASNELIFNDGAVLYGSLPAFNTLAPTTTKGDVIAHDGTNNVRVPIGTNGYSLVADSAEASGVKWHEIYPIATVRNPSSPTNYDLPSAGVLANQIYRLSVGGATNTNYVALRSSDETEITRIREEGYIVVQALQDTPTTPAHWAIISRFQKYEIDLRTGTTDFSASANNIAYLVRRDDQVTLIGKGSWGFTSPDIDRRSDAEVIPAEFRPKNTVANNIYTGVNLLVGAGQIIVLLDSSGSSTLFAPTITYIAD